MEEEKMERQWVAYKGLGGRNARGSDEAHTQQLGLERLACCDPRLNLKLNMAQYSGHICSSD